MGSEHRSSYSQRIQNLSPIQLISHARKNALMHDLSTIVITAGFVDQLTSLSLMVQNQSDDLSAKINILIFAALGLATTQFGALTGMLYIDRYLHLKKLANQRKIQIPESITYKMLN